MADVVGDGTGDVFGPFEMAQKGFHREQVLSPYAGWFGEVNRDFVEAIKSLARQAAAGEVRMAISPLVNMDRKGGAYPIML